MSEHLTDYEVVLLVTGPASRALRQTLSAHLAVCEECRARVAESAREEMRAEDLQASEDEKSGADPDFVQQIVRAVSSAHPRMNGVSDVGRVIPLFRAPADGQPNAFPLAARSPGELKADLPVLVSGDSLLRVRFRKAEDGSGYTCYIIGDLPGTGADLCIAFPKLNRAFPIDRDGKALLPGIEYHDLRDGKIQIELNSHDSTSE